MTPETHTRYRVQRLIRLGEWLEKNMDALIMGYDQIDDAHDMLVDIPEGLDAAEVTEIVGFKQMQALKVWSRLMSELRHDVPCKHVRRGADVTIHKPFAYKDEWQVVIPAPQPKDVPSQEEYEEAQQDFRLDYLAQEEYEESLKDKAS